MFAIKVVRNEDGETRWLKRKLTDNLLNTEFFFNKERCVFNVHKHVCDVTIAHLMTKPSASLVTFIIEEM